MELRHTFTVPADLDTTWRAFGDIESVAGCFPGAVVTEVDGEEFKGTCKVKLGPIALTYAGTGSFVERDETAKRFVVEAKGKDKRGNGTAGATVTATFAGDSGSTEVVVETDLAITGKPAQFGRGVIQDVSDKLLGQFVDCLERTVGDAASPAEAASGVAGVTAPGATASGAAASGTTQAAPAASTHATSVADAAVGSTPVAVPEPAGATAGPAAPATESGSSAESGRSVLNGVPAAAAPPPTGRPAQADNDTLNLGATVLPALARAYWQPLAGILTALLVLRWLRGRRHR